MTEKRSGRNSAGAFDEKGRGQLPMPVMASIASYCWELRLFFMPSPSMMSRSTISPPREQMTPKWHSDKRSGNAWRFRLP